MKARVLVVVPARNEERTIAAVLAELRQSAPCCDRVVINDASSDATGQIVAEMGEWQISLPSRLGYGHALATGLRYALTAGYEIIVSFDADGQHRAEDVPRLVAAIEEGGGVDVVIGSRFSEGRSYSGPMGRRIGQLLFSHFTRILVGRRIYDTTSGFKALRSRACKALIGYPFVDFHTESIVRLTLLGFKIKEIPITVREREYGRSMHSFVSFFEYPVKTLLVTVVAAIDSVLHRGAR